MADAAPQLALASQHHDVVVLRWPEQTDDVARLDLLGVPRLLLVEPGAEPPTSASCLQDWLRLPASDADVRARLHALSSRAEHHPSRPTVDTLGQLSHRGQAVFLSHLDQRIAEVLVRRFAEAVPDDDLRAQVWPEGATEQALRVHISRLRRRLVPLGLTITCVRNVGYAMHEDTARPTLEGS